MGSPAEAESTTPLQCGEGFLLGLCPHQLDLCARVGLCWADRGKHPLGHCFGLRQRQVSPFASPRPRTRAVGPAMAWERRDEQQQASGNSARVQCAFVHKTGTGRLGRHGDDLVVQDLSPADLDQEPGQAVEAGEARREARVLKREAARVPAGAGGRSISGGVAAKSGSFGSLYVYVRTRHEGPPHGDGGTCGEPNETTYTQHSWPFVMPLSSST